MSVYERFRVSENMPEGLAIVLGVLLLAVIIGAFVMLVVISPRRRGTPETEARYRAGRARRRRQASLRKRREALQRRNGRRTD